MRRHWFFFLMFHAMIVFIVVFVACEAIAYLWRRWKMRGFPKRSRRPLVPTIASRRDPKLYYRFVGARVSDFVD